MTGEEENRMPYDPERHHRRSIRLKGYDYSQPGAYFVRNAAYGVSHGQKPSGLLHATINTYKGQCLFGEVVDREMVLNDTDRMAQSVWDELPLHYPGVDVDAFIIMPNHIHGIIVLTGESAPTTPVGAGPRARPEPAPQTGQPRTIRRIAGAPTENKPLPLPDVVHRFKSFTTTCYRQAVIEQGWPRFPGRLWQRNYYEHGKSLRLFLSKRLAPASFLHIIRNEQSLERIRKLTVAVVQRLANITGNPARWADDPLHPDRVADQPIPEEPYRWEET
jgi:REP element-mobilizing transposase RayT